MCKKIITKLQTIKNDMTNNTSPTKNPLQNATVLCQYFLWETVFLLMNTVNINTYCLCNSTLEKSDLSFFSASSLNSQLSQTFLEYYDIS